jgi:serine protease
MKSKRTNWVSGLVTGLTMGLAFGVSMPAVHAAEVRLKLAPSGADGSARAAELARGVGATAKPGPTLNEYTLTGAGPDAVRTLREASDVLWASRVTDGAATVLRPGASKKAALSAPKYHPRLIRIRIKEDAMAGSDAAKATLVPRFSALANNSLSLHRARPDTVLMRTAGPLVDETFAALAEALGADPAVASVERVRIMRPHNHVQETGVFGGALPNDPLLNLQWSLSDPMSGINAQEAWKLAGTRSVVVAVLDTGSTAHPDLDRKWVPGYDMVSFGYLSQDGDDARDPNPNDEGDFEDFQTCDNFYRFGSSWHGTHVAGIIAAEANNNEGVAGVAPNARIQTVRVLGRCGGLTDDINDGIKWAAGVPVAGAPTNPTPAKVLNLSLGGSGPCDEDTQKAVDAALARGAIIVVAAGNEEEDAVNATPANCKGVITVGASDRTGDAAFYSNYGETVAIFAPGGSSRAESPTNDNKNFGQIVSTLNGGSVVQTSSMYQWYQGTSMAAPHVAGVAALMLSRDPTLTPGQLANRLQSSARPFARDTACSASGGLCGAGLLDAAKAVASVADRRTALEMPDHVGRVRMVEMWNKANNHFTIVTDGVEQAEMLGGKRGGDWKLTGESIDAFDFTAIASNIALPVTVCRYRNPANGAIRFSANHGVCNEWNHVDGWRNEGWPFLASLQNRGTCDAGATPVYEMISSDDLSTSRFRYVWSGSEYDASIKAGWKINGIAFCTPNR